ncbi:hypothetical protein EI056_04255 [Escherichia coli]|nr:hypothetical protein [Escherichia coli]
MQCSLSESSGCNFVHMRTFMFHISNLWVLCLILKQHQQLLRFHLPANFSCCRLDWPPESPDNQYHLNK